MRILRERDTAVGNSVTIDLPGQDAVLEAVQDLSEKVSRIESQVHSGRIAYTYRQAAEVTGLSVRFLQGEVAAGRLRARKAGGRTIVGHTDLLDWIERLPDAAHDRDMSAILRKPPSRTTGKLRGLSNG